MCQAHDGGSAETQILETEPDIKQHQDQSHADCDQGVALHLITDGGADGLGSNAVLVDRELLDQLIGQFRTLFRIQDDRLEDDLIAAGNLLDLYIAVTGHFGEDRDDLALDLLQAHVFIEADIGGSTADEVKAVIEGIA